VNRAYPATHRYIVGVALMVSAIVLPHCVFAEDNSHTLRIQTHFGADTTSGKLLAQFVDDVQTMSEGKLKLDLHYSSSFVKADEAFESAAAGVIDGDMTSPSYLITKDPAFQFVANPVGAYESPNQLHAWYLNSGAEPAQKLYRKYGVELIGWWIHDTESLASEKPLRGIQDLKHWTFRSPMGLQAKVFHRLGANPINLALSEVLDALENKEIEGADASGLANNVTLGLYKSDTHATYPGFHSMPVNHLAINKSKWDALPIHLQRIVKVAMQSLAFQTSVTFAAKNQQAATQLANSGVTLHNWSVQDRKAFRQAAQTAWANFAKGSADAQAIMQSHRAFLRSLGLLDQD